MSARISWISLTPVKALALNHVDEIELREGGLRGDRRFYLVDERDRLVNDKRHGQLQLVHARHDEERVALSLRLADGTVVEGEVVGGEALTTYFHKRVLPARRVPGPWDEALSDVAREPVRLVEATQLVELHQSPALSGAVELEEPIRRVDQGAHERHIALALAETPRDLGKAFT